MVPHTAFAKLHGLACLRHGCSPDPSLRLGGHESRCHIRRRTTWAIARSMLIDSLHRCEPEPGNNGGLRTSNIRRRAYNHPPRSINDVWGGIVGDSPPEQCPLTRLLQRPEGGMTRPVLLLHSGE
ncbi:hypothetical protein BV20DRAFT_754518 [Pilatotrama ljubarskyi]|nr:hypothetical protein BV20DRAFT_754518 [Pilatotrama ljubarskyi]